MLGVMPVSSSKLRTVPVSNTEKKREKKKKEREKREKKKKHERWKQITFNMTYYLSDDTARQSTLFQIFSDDNNLNIFLNVVDQTVASSGSRCFAKITKWLL